MELQHFHQNDVQYPTALTRFFGSTAPSSIATLGDYSILQSRKLALFCSEKCPGHAILAAYDQAARWRDEGRCVISGFHSPVEKECLRILLRGQQPIIICLARSLPKRVPPDLKNPLTNGRLLILSCFNEGERRVTAELAARRNELVAALADEVWFAHIAPGGNMAELSEKLKAI
jgi:predicted Rossmann fold nucleotide-binding protein DprA/Smf involved in DNA uptake